MNYLCACICIVNLRPIRCLFDNKNESETPILNQQKNVKSLSLWIWFEIINQYQK